MKLDAVVAGFALAERQKRNVAGRETGSGFRRYRAGARLAAVLAGPPAAALLASMMLSSPASADLGALSCGAPIKSIVKQKKNDEQIVTSTSFVNVAGAAVAVNVPAGQTRCIRIRFSSSLKCEAPDAISHCYIKPEDSISPFLFSSTVFATDEPGGAHSHEWAAHLSEGNHAIRIRALVNSGVTFTLIDWTFAVDVAE